MRVEPPDQGGRDLTTDVLDWFDAHQRDLPWRAPDRTPWGVLVSEVMLQQTPVSRVLPAWQDWMLRWPTPSDLADEVPGEAVRQWGRLGYPRRALRLHAAATRIAVEHHGAVPSDETALRALPGVGEYTAAAVRAFAFGRRAVVLDTNVRRVLARLVGGQENPPAGPTVAERSEAEALLPVDDAAAARWSVAVMELGALVCTAVAPDCPQCPLAGSCAWRSAGRPQGNRPRLVQRFEGTDRQARGRLMAVLRAASAPVGSDQLAGAWPTDPIQRERALRGLIADGLVEMAGKEGYWLPGLARATRTAAER